MKKYVLLLAILLMFSAVVAACGEGGAEGTAAVPGSTLGVTEETEVTDVEETPFGEASVTLTGTLPTQTTGPETSIVETPIATATQGLSAATEMPTASATEAASVTQTSGITATQGVTGTQQLPGTGAGTPEALSNLFGLTIVNQNGELLGSARDYILNLCESHILYIVVGPSTSLGVTSGENILIPYEVVSVHGGQVNTDDKGIVVDLDAATIQGAPAFTPAELSLTTTDWESEVTTFWSQDYPMTLTSECNVQAPDLSGQGQSAVGTPAATAEVTATVTTTQTTPGATEGTVAVNKIAFASKVLNFQLQDGNGTPLGHVEEVIVSPATGRIEFVAVSLDTSLDPNGKMVLVPMRALNLGETEAGQFHLVLLVDTQVLQDAPAISDIPTVFDENWNADAFDYWSQQVQMTREGE